MDGSYAESLKQRIQQLPKRIEDFHSRFLPLLLEREPSRGFQIFLGVRLLKELTDHDSSTDILRFSVPRFPPQIWAILQVLKARENDSHAQL